MTEDCAMGFNPNTSISPLASDVSLHEMRISSRTRSMNGLLSPDYGWGPESPLDLWHLSCEDLQTSATESWLDDDRAAPSDHRPRKKRLRIELAPDQPPTTLGKPRARVYIACDQCRTRKTRCDGAKPACYNCTHGKSASARTCTYDEEPKRRGPDKALGIRRNIVRRSRGEYRGGSQTVLRPLRRRDAPTHRSDRYSGGGPPLSPLPVTPLLGLFEGYLDPQSNGVVAKHSELSRRNMLYGDFQLQRMDLAGFDDISPTFTYLGGDELPHGFANTSFNDVDILSIASEPSLAFYRKTWWDCLLATYLSSSGSWVDPICLTMTQRQDATALVTTDLRILFRTSNSWLSFIHVPRFFSTFNNPVARENLQPSFIIMACALSVFWQSSEIGRGKAGRDLALRLRDQAEGALQASINAGWLDENLAIAAWIAVMFENTGNPRHSTSRSVSSMRTLDQIIRTLSLTTIDADDPCASTFAPREVPRVASLRSSSSHATDERDYGANSSSVPHLSTREGCDCTALSVGHRWPGASEYTPLWLCAPAWGENWSEAEFRKETCRRVCWSAVISAAGFSSYATAQSGGFQAEGLDLFITEPSNFALLFPGEAITTHHDAKNSIWALNYRTMLVWQSCVHMRRDLRASDAEKARFAIAAWLEVDNLEAQLNRHTCGLERAYLFQGRECLFNTRLCISYEFQRFIPVATANLTSSFHRRKAEEWLRHQATVAKQITLGLHTVTGHWRNDTLSQRPYFTFWFMGQINRALSLWALDRTLTVALDASKALLAPIDHLTLLWPCQEQRLRYSKLRGELGQACLYAGLPPPEPLPLISTSQIPLVAPVSPVCLARYPTRSPLSQADLLGQIY